ncbi:sn-glycerol-1-phosphate dehydrogenase [Luteococcus peritonei]|uniref:Sn-glycerol-1-phosphate dehydrogenase n=1 Tax=Luteococcus peritonei TaxID=88874 RepID=A0ABW4RXP4_9ACTN
MGIVEQALAAADQTDAVSVGRGVLADSGRLLRETLCGPTEPRAVVLVADDNTWSACGEEVRDSLQRAGVPLAEPMVFPGRPAPYASLDNARSIADHLRSQDVATSSPVVPVCIGAGTLNDLVKLAAHDLDRRYAVVGTAASMDGYTGAGAPISDDGVKVTINCTAPQVVVFDLDVAAQAPAEMVAGGYGDLSAKIPGGADWILADAAGVEAVDEDVWELVQSGVREALAQPAALAAGQAEAYEGLVQGLVLSGLAMQAYGGTRPASGAEHYFSHIWELEHLGADRTPPLSHGFKVAIGTLAMLAFYERFMARDLASLDIEAAVAAWPAWSDVEADIRRTFSGALAEHAVAETKVKYVEPDKLRERLQRLVASWPETRRRLADQLVDAREFAAMLRQAGAPSRPEDIGLDAEAVRATFPKAMYYRSRYTVLDVAREAGWYDELVAETFAPGGLWS